MKKDINKLVSYYVKKYNTRNPFELADYLNVQILIGNLGNSAGCYMFLKNHKCIFLNENLSEQELMMVMAHELGHAVLHRKDNCYFIRNKTLLLNSKKEIEANTFAAELLIPDEVILNNPGMTKQQISRLVGYHEKIIEFKKCRGV